MFKKIAKNTEMLPHLPWKLFIGEDSVLWLMVAGLLAFTYGMDIILIGLITLLVIIRTILKKHKDERELVESVKLLKRYIYRNSDLTPEQIAEIREKYDNVDWDGLF